MFSNFNPRTHKECDTWSPAVEDATTGFQSTPHKECDLSLFAFVARRTYFNPRTHKECDEIINPAYDWFNKFQSTHSQGVRLNGGSYLNVNVDISIHALTKSATHFQSHCLTAKKYFNPRTHKECDK